MARILLPHYEFQEAITEDMNARCPLCKRYLVFTMFSNCGHRICLPCHNNNYFSRICIVCQKVIPFHPVPDTAFDALVAKYISTRDTSTQTDYAKRRIGAQYSHDNHQKQKNKKTRKNFDEEFSSLEEGKGKKVKPGHNQLWNRLKQMRKSLSNMNVFRRT